MMQVLAEIAITAVPRGGVQLWKENGKIVFVAVENTKAQPRNVDDVLAWARRRAPSITLRATKRKAADYGAEVDPRALAKRRLPIKTALARREAAYQEWLIRMASEWATAKAGPTAVDCPILNVADFRPVCA
jgi:hypothetical protein